MYGRFRQTPGMELWIPLFCRGNHYECARFQLDYRGLAVHERLLPNGEYLP